MSEKDIVAFLHEAARYFENRDTGGEDMAFWANVTNAKNCREAADTIERLRTEAEHHLNVRGGYASEIGRLQAERYTVDEALAAALTRAAEMREACAKVAEEWHSPLRPGNLDRKSGHMEASRDIASAIRELKVEG